MNQIFDEKGKAFQVFAVVTIILTITGIGKSLLLPQIFLTMLGSVLIIQQVHKFKIGDISKGEFFFNLVFRVGIVAWFAYFYFTYSIWLPQGKEVADATYSVKFSSHGNITYITPQQSQNSSILKWLGFIGIITNLVRKKGDRIG